MKKKKINLKKAIPITICILVLLGSGGYFAKTKYFTKKVNASPQQQMAEQMKSLVTTAKKDDLIDILSATGVVALDKEYYVYAGSKQNVLSIPFAIGDDVKKGDVLITYDTNDEHNTLKETVDQTQISLDNAKLQAQALVSPPSDSKLITLNSSISSAEKSVASAQDSLTSAKSAVTDSQAAIATQQTTVDKAKNDMDNYKTLLDAGTISENDYDAKVITYNNAVSQMDSLDRALALKKQAVDTAALNLVSAQSDVTTAQKQLAIAENPMEDSSNKNTYEQDLNNIKLLELKLADAQKSLDEEVTQVVSPYDGTIESIKAVEGNNQQIGEVALTITNYNDLIVTANISEYDIGSLTLGQAVTMYSDGDPKTIYNGKIIEIGNTASSVSVNNGKQNVVEIKVSLENAPAIKSGFGLNLDIVKYDIKDALTVASTAIQAVDNKKYVYVVEKDGTIKKTEIVTGQVGATNTQITSGLKENDRVIKEITDKINDGMKISALISTTTSKNPSGGASSNVAVFDGGGFGGGGGGVRSYGGGGGGRINVGN